MTTPPVQSSAPQTVRNHYAIIAWYVGIFSFLPYVGAVLGVIAIVLGVRGLRFARRLPNRPGRGKAVVGIICGVVYGTANMVAVVALVMALRS